MSTYVYMTDKAMSGWGLSKGMINKYVVECDTWEQADAIYSAALDRDEMKHVNVSKSKPYFSPGRYLVSLRHFLDLSGPWLKYYNAQ